MPEWDCEGNPPQYPAHPLISNPEDVDICTFCGRPRDLTQVSSQRGGAGKSPLPLILGVLGLLLLGLGGGYLFWKLSRPSTPVVTPTESPTEVVTPTPSTITPTSADVSSGETRLMSSQSNPDGERGITAFKLGNYQQAVEDFTKAIQSDRRNPEYAIYLNNAKARLAGSPLVIAAVVPIDNALTSAEEMLRGIADAQTRFNDAGGLNNRLLEVVIANDGNDPSRATLIARQLVSNANILGVIGHNASDASKAGLAEYETAGLGMISPTSTSVELQGNSFARTVPSDAVNGQKLADYAINKLNLREVAVFYHPQSSYSKSLEQAFTNQFQQKGGKIVKTVDLSSSSFDPLTEVVGLQGQVQGIVLLPNTKFTSVAIAVAVANSKLPPAQQMKLLGGDALYNPTTLISGGNAVQGLTLVVPWFAKTSYAQEAEKRWLGQVGWRTAMSLDATNALIKAISADPNPSRASVLQNLKTVNIPASETSGDSIEFEANGDRRIQPIIVEIAPGTGGPQGSKLEFKPVN